MRLFYENEAVLRDFCSKHSIVISLDQIWKDLGTDDQRQAFVDRAAAWKADQEPQGTEATSKPVELPRVAVEPFRAAVELPAERPIPFTDEEALANPKGARKRLAEIVTWDEAAQAAEKAALVAPATSSPDDAQPEHRSEWLELGDLRSRLHITDNRADALQRQVEDMHTRQELQMIHIRGLLQDVETLRNQVAALSSSPAHTQAEALSETLNQAPTTQAAPATEPTSEPRPIDLTPKGADPASKGTKVIKSRDE